MAHKINTKAMFFTDLDRTIIYSKGFLDSCDKKYVCVEKKDEKDISYMTEEAISCLKLLRQEVEFIPVTARTFAEISRINFIKEDMPNIMVCESGCAIYIYGVRNAEWDRYIDSKVGELGDYASQAQNLFKSLIEEKGETVRQTNKHMMMTKFSTDEVYDKEYLESMSPLFKMLGYVYSLQAPRKVYLTPSAISKGEAIRKLIDFYSPEFTVSAGDAEMDYSMFKYTNLHTAPYGHTIANNSINTTRTSGLLAGEDILIWVLSAIKMRNAAVSLN